MEAVWRYFKVNRSVIVILQLRLNSPHALFLIMPLLIYRRVYCIPNLLVHILNSTPQIQLPGYLRALPLPRTFGGFLDLTREEWLTLLPFFITMAILFYLMVVPFANLCFKKEKRPRINRKQQMDAPKVATKFDIEDLGDKKVFCRCWKSNRVSCPHVWTLGVNFWQVYCCMEVVV